MSGFDVTSSIRRFTQVVVTLGIAATLLTVSLVAPVRAQERDGENRASTGAAPSDPDLDAPYPGSGPSATNPGPDPYARPSTRTKDVLTILLPVLGAGIIGGVVGGKRGAAYGAVGGGMVGGILLYRRHRPRGPIYPKPYPRQSPFRSE